MFLTIIGFAVIMVGFIIWMPYGAKLVAYKYEQNKKAQEPNKIKHINEHTYQGYQAPDEVLQDEKPTGRSSGLKKVTTDDIPIKVRLNQPQLKRRKERLDIDTDPNTYDYDIDNLSEDEIHPTTTNKETV